MIVTSWPWHHNRDIMIVLSGLCYHDRVMIVHHVRSWHVCLHVQFKLALSGLKSQLDVLSSTTLLPLLRLRTLLPLQRFCPCNNSPLWPCGPANTATTHARPIIHTRIIEGCKTTYCWTHLCRYSAQKHQMLCRKQKRRECMHSRIYKGPHREQALGLARNKTK